jgi:hypothetical protein
MEVVHMVLSCRKWLMQTAIRPEGYRMIVSRRFPPPGDVPGGPEEKEEEDEEEEAWDDIAAVVARLMM